MNTHTDEWVPFVEHQRLGLERSARFEQAKAENSNYLPLLDSTFKKIDEEFAQKQLTAAMITLLQKCVHIRGGKTHTGSCFEGRVLINAIRRSDKTDACVYLGGFLVDDQGRVDRRHIVQIRISTLTLLSYQK